MKQQVLENGIGGRSSQDSAMSTALHQHPSWCWNVHAAKRFKVFAIVFLLMERHWCTQTQAKAMCADNALRPRCTGVIATAHKESTAARTKWTQLPQRKEHTWHLLKVVSPKTLQKRSLLWCIDLRMLLYCG
jgi:hypothetical protein